MQFVIKFENLIFDVQTVLSRPLTSCSDYTSTYTTKFLAYFKFGNFLFQIAANVKIIENCQKAKSVQLVIKIINVIFDV